MTDRELLQDALDALTYVGDKDIYSGTIDALRARLAQPKPDYEAEFIKDWNEGKVRRVSDGKRMAPEREWVGLTDDEIEDCLEMSIQGTCRAIEAKLKEKNT